MTRVGEIHDTISRCSLACPPTSGKMACLELAIWSPLTMHPKSTRCNSDSNWKPLFQVKRSELKDFVTCCSLAFPPTSKKLAGAPPCILKTSMVVIAKSAPLTVQMMIARCISKSRRVFELGSSISRALRLCQPLLAGVPSDIQRVGRLASGFPDYRP
jgi:hypothetical protein